jgi:hypothetical protein
MSVSWNQVIKNLIAIGTAGASTATAASTSSTEMQIAASIIGLIALIYGALTGARKN